MASCLRNTSRCFLPSREEWPTTIPQQRNEWISEKYLPTRELWPQSINYKLEASRLIFKQVNISYITRYAIYEQGLGSLLLHVLWVQEVPRRRKLKPSSIIFTAQHSLTSISVLYKFMAKPARSLQASICDQGLFRWEASSTRNSEARQYLSKRVHTLMVMWFKNDWNTAVKLK